MPTRRSHIQNEIIEIIKDHDGKPCPSNIQLSARLGIVTRRVSDFLCIMIRNGQLIKHGYGTLRAFEVVGTGKKTLRQNTEPEDALTKWAPCDRGKVEILKASNLPTHVWYGPRDRDGNPIRQKGV